MVTVAQLVRALACEASGCGFESHQPPRLASNIVKPCPVTWVSLFEPEQ